MSIIKLKRTKTAYDSATHKLYPGELTVIQDTLYFGAYDGTRSSDSTTYVPIKLANQWTNNNFTGNLTFSGAINLFQYATDDTTKNVSFKDAGGTEKYYVMGGRLSTDLTTFNSENLVNKAYVDGAVQGLDIKASVKAATTANITLSGPQTIDGYSAVAENRILVKSQTLLKENGIYIVKAGSWIRATDANTWDALVSAFVFVEEGSTLADTGWTCTINSTGTLETNDITWTQFSGAGAYTADETSLTRNATVFSIKNAGVTYAKIQDIAGLSVIGRSANSSGVSAAITAVTNGHVLRLSGTTLGFGTLTSGAFAANTMAISTIVNSAAAGLSVLGRNTNGAGSFAEIAAGADGQVLRRSNSTTLAFGTLTSGAFDTNTAIPYSSLANSAVGMVLGHSGSSSSAVVAITSSTQGHVLKVGSSSGVSFGYLTNENIDANAAIVDTKLATIATSNKVSLTALNISGATAIEEALADGDLFGVYNLSATANRYTSGANLKTYIYGSLSNDLTVTSAGVVTITKSTGAFTTGGQLTVGTGGGTWSIDGLTANKLQFTYGTQVYELPNNKTAGTYVLATINDVPEGVKTSDVTTAPSTSYYLSFVDSNNASPTIETLYTRSTLSFVPSTGVLTATEFSGLIDGGIWA